MKGMNIIQLNTLHLNVVLLNGDEMPGEVVVGGGEVVPVPPTEPETPDVPDVPVEPKKFILSASVTNGMVSAKRNGSAVNLPYTANEGDTIVLEVTPNDGYAFEGWADGNTDNPRTITMNADVALSAECVEVVQPPVGNYIQFEDKNVEAICVANWSSDGIGLTEEDVEGVTSLGRMFMGNTTITSFMELALFGSVNILAYDEFKACSNLESIDLSNIKHLGKGAFTECPNLTNYGSLENLESLGDYAFNGTAISGVLRMPKLITLNGTNGNTLAQTNITNIADLGRITEIPAYFFCYSTNLEKVTIPDSVISIQRDAFAYCTKLKTFIIGGGIESIARGILWQCTAIESIVCKAVTPPLLAEGFVGTNSTFSIYVPDASLEAYKTATNWNQYSARIKPLSEYNG